MAAGKPGRGMDVNLAEELAVRAAVALDNALLVRDIKDADRRKNEFLAMLSHELRNPLAPVRNAVQILNCCGIDHPQLRTARDVIDRQVTHLARLVDDLLDVSRITRGKIRLQLEVIDIARVVASAVETSRPLIEKHGHDLIVTLPESSIRVRGDAARLAQALANLLNNAAKYTPDGGRIWLIGEIDETDVVLRVRDTGAGIPTEMLVRVFDLFTQVDRSLDRSQGGLGIGLTLVKQLIEMHGGRVRASSAGLGRGSEFVVRLPIYLADPTVSARADNGLAVKRDPKNRRVLVVDDNVDSAESLATLLRLDGHDVRLAHSGPAAVETAQIFNPEVMLLDIGLPGFDGYEVARRWRNEPKSQSTLIVAISGYGQDEDRHRSRQAGIDHHLTKPIDFCALEKMIAAGAISRVSG
jgi:CheY-like chemotaxis protein/nitrogen-specific signal transduction histidine kinase